MKFSNRDLKDKAIELFKSHSENSFDGYHELNGIDTDIHSESTRDACLITCTEVIDLQLDLCHDDNITYLTDFYTKLSEYISLHYKTLYSEVTKTE